MPSFQATGRRPWETFLNSAAATDHAGVRDQQIDDTRCASLKQQLETDGFVLVPELCDSVMVETLLEVARQQAAAVRAALGTRDIGIGSAAGFIEIVQRSPGRWDVPISPEQFGFTDRQMPWWPLITAILGEDAEHSFSGVVSSEPGSPAQHWHTDSPHEAPEHLQAHALNVLVALHEVPLAMGPTECARGSHVLTNHLHNPSLVLAQLIYQHAGTSPKTLVAGSAPPAPECHATAMSAGTCLIFDDRLLHRGLANDADAVRHVGYFSYRRAGYSVNTHFESQQSVFAGSS
jgi:hypothetical protein